METFEFEGQSEEEVKTTTEGVTETATTSPQTLADRQFNAHFEMAKAMLNLPDAENTTASFPTNFQNLLSQLKDVAEKGDPQLRFEKIKKVDSLLVKFMEVNKERAEADLEARRHKTNPVKEQREKLATIVIDLHKNGRTVTPSTTVIVDNKGVCLELDSTSSYVVAACVFQWSLS